MALEEQKLDAWPLAMEIGRSWSKKMLLIIGESSMAPADIALAKKKRALGGLVDWLKRLLCDMLPPYGAPHFPPGPWLWS